MRKKWDAYFVLNKDLLDLPIFHSLIHILYKIIYVIYVSTMWHHMLSSCIPLDQSNFVWPSWGWDSSTAFGLCCAWRSADFSSVAHPAEVGCSLIEEHRSVGNGEWWATKSWLTSDRPTRDLLKFLVSRLSLVLFTSVYHIDKKYLGWLPIITVNHGCLAASIFKSQTTLYGIMIWSM